MVFINSIRCLSDFPPRMQRARKVMLWYSSSPAKSRNRSFTITHESIMTTPMLPSHHFFSEKICFIISGDRAWKCSVTKVQVTFSYTPCQSQLRRITGGPSLSSLTHALTLTASQNSYDFSTHLERKIFSQPFAVFQSEWFYSPASGVEEVFHPAVPGLWTSHQLKRSRTKKPS